jgi:NADH:ubiquinone oxidoreductase subunit 3 (subunit A)
VATLLFFAIAGEFVRMGWYGSAAMSIFTALLTMRWLWLFLAGFSVGRMFRR